MPSRSPRSSSATGSCDQSARVGQEALTHRRCGGFSLLEVIVALAILGIGLGVVFQGIGQGLRLRGESGENVRLALVAERILGGLPAREGAPEAPEEGEEAGCRWRLEPLEPPAGPGGTAGSAPSTGGRGARLVEVRITVAAPSGRSLKMSTLLPEPPR